MRDLTIVDVRFRHLPHAPREVTNVPSAIVTGVPGRDAPVLPVGSRWRCRTVTRSRRAPAASARREHSVHPRAHDVAGP